MNPMGGTMVVLTIKIVKRVNMTQQTSDGLQDPKMAKIQQLDQLNPQWLHVILN